MKIDNYKIDLFNGLLLALGFLIGQSIAYAIGAGISAFTTADVTNNGWYMLLAYTITMISPILMFYFLVVKRNQAKFNFNFSLGSFTTLLLIFPMMLGMMMITDVVTDYIPKDGVFFGYLYELYEKQLSLLSLDVFTLILMTVVFAPILEEILFRGIILKGLINNNNPPIFAIVISSFIFGAVHIFPWQVVGAFLLGLVMGLAYYKTKSLLIAILLHFFNNLLSALFMLYSDSGSFTDILQISQEYVLLIGVLLFTIPFIIFVRK